jgi:lipopolysaccharide transport system ATP-binding protein
MSSDVAISVKGLSKCYQIYRKPRDRLLQMLVRGRKMLYREFWALRDIDFEVRRGETVGIIGRNGSGKSTLLQLICGTLSPTEGQVITHGRIAALLELGSGFNPEFSGRENVFLNAAIYGLTPVEIGARFDQIVAFSEIGEFIDQPVKTYSSGMFVRLAFAVVAHVDADILIIDEALSVGDAAFSRKCSHFLRQFMERGTVLFVSHDTASVKNLCNRAIWLERGQLMVDGDPKAVSDAYLKHLYESTQGTHLTSVMPLKMAGASASAQRKMPRDMRQNLLNASTLRNDIQVLEMHHEFRGFGQGGASLNRVSLEDEAGNPLSWIIGGEIVQLIIEGIANRALDQPIVGFTLKDRLGQYLFGDNTYLTCLDAPVPVFSGQVFLASFRFMMPALRAGDYTIDVAVANGTQSDHVQHLWVNDALTLKSVTGSVCTGLLGIPMEEVSLRVI